MPYETADAAKTEPSHPPPSDWLQAQLFDTRALSTEIAKPLSDEDQVVQAMDDASPTKWHLAHTTWFFETFVLHRFDETYEPYDERFTFCFNSYYEAEGERHPRSKKGTVDAAKQ